MPHRAEQRTGLFTNGLQKGEELLCKGEISRQDGAVTHVCSFHSHPLTEITAGSYTQQEVHHRAQYTTRGHKRTQNQRFQNGNTAWNCGGG